MSLCWHVVIEWNQASGQPRLASDDLHDTELDAAEAANELAAEAARIGRGERYTVHEVRWDERDEYLVDPPSTTSAPNPSAVTE